MSETYLITFKVKPDKLDRFHALLGGVLDAMRHEENYRSSLLLEDPDDPCHLTLCETWVDRADVLEVQLKKPYRDDWHAALPDLLEGERAISIWNPVRGDGGTRI